ncbi:HAD family phosphatase [Pseudoxanthomonas putridarboris]|uniref:HAD family phosphatase n=1 Tax=Pseudoxanthomonas putridarboris TaxID=752605 RepID=A0ABU9IYS5_9GAMM
MALASQAPDFPLHLFDPVGCRPACSVRRRLLRVACAPSLLGSVEALSADGGDVASGKPSPEGYVLAAARLGVLPGECLVFEDAPAGILAKEAAGARVLVITSAHAHPVDAGRHLSARDYTGLEVIEETDGRFTPIGA